MLRGKRVALLFGKAVFRAVAGIVAGLLVAILIASLWDTAEARCLSPSEVRAGKGGHPRYRVRNGQQCWYVAARGERRARGASRKSMRVSSYQQRRHKARSRYMPPAVARGVEPTIVDLEPDTPQPTTRTTQTAGLQSVAAAPPPPAAPAELQPTRIRIDDAFGELAPSPAPALEKAAPMPDAPAETWSLAWLAWAAVIGLLGLFVHLATNAQRTVVLYEHFKRFARVRGQAFLAAAGRQSAAAMRAAIGLIRRTCRRNRPITQAEIVQLLGRAQLNRQPFELRQAA